MGEEKKAEGRRQKAEERPSPRSLRLPGPRSPLAGAGCGEVRMVNGEFSKSREGAETKPLCA
jgi:hypothetical protein